MAKTNKPTENAVEHEVKTQEAVVKETKANTPVAQEELNLDAKVTVRNLSGWDVTFARLHDGVGEILIVANGQARLSRNEIIAQIDNNNVLFVGYNDGKGSHAAIVIEDAPTRRWVGFEDDDRQQNVFTEQIVVDLFKMNQENYENAVREKIQTRAEKYAFTETIKKLRLNDHSKMVFASEYTGYKL